jgi:hypothetical protein
MNWVQKAAIGLFFRLGWWHLPSPLLFLGRSPALAPCRMSKRHYADGAITVPANRHAGLLGPPDSRSTVAIVPASNTNIPALA